MAKKITFLQLSHGRTMSKVLHLSHAKEEKTLLWLKRALLKISMSMTYSYGGTHPDRLRKVINNILLGRSRGTT